MPARDFYYLAIVLVAIVLLVFICAFPFVYFKMRKNQTYNDYKPSDNGCLMAFMWVFAWPSYLWMKIIDAIRRRPKKCPNCGARKYALVSREVAEKATARKEGKRTDHFKCSVCGHEADEEITVGKLVINKRRRKFGSSSGRSGGFGGGSSSGGGASGKW